MARITMSSPWIIYYREVQALFACDPEVHVVFYEDEYLIKLHVENANKAEALSLLLPNQKVFGNVTLKITVVPPNYGVSNFPKDCSKEKLFDIAFNNNTAYSFSKTITSIFLENITYVVFKKHVVQYFNDDLGDIYGQCSTLYQDIAKDVFDISFGVFFCTDKCEDTFDSFAEEWP